MPIIQLPQRRISLPQRQARIKAAYRKNLVLATEYQHGVARDVTGLTVTGVGGSYTHTKLGRGYLTDTSGTKYMSWGNPSALQFSNTSDFTIVSLFSLSAGEGTIRMLLAKDDGGSPRPLFQWRVDGTDKLNCVWGHTSNTLGSITGSTHVGQTTQYNQTHCAGFRRAAGVSAAIFLDGRLDASGADGATGTWTITGGNVVTDYEASHSSQWVGTKHLDLVFDRALSDAELIEITGNAASIYDSDEISVYFSAAAGGATHATSGALTGQSSSIAGTSAHIAKHATTGALTGPGSTVAGTSAHIAKHTTSGTLTGQSSAISGTSAHVAKHTTTGALTGQIGAVAGTCVHRAKHTTSGVLSGQIGSIVGAAARSALASHACTGALIGTSSIMVCSAAHGNGAWFPTSDETDTWANVAAASSTWTPVSPSSTTWS